MLVELNFSFTVGEHDCRKRLLTSAHSGGFLHCFRRKKCKPLKHLPNLAHVKCIVGLCWSWKQGFRDFCVEVNGREYKGIREGLNCSQMQVFLYMYYIYIYIYV